MVIDFGNVAALNIPGNLVNAGRLYAVSSNPQTTTAIFNAANIHNQQGALFSSILPAGGIAGVTAGVSNLSLVLNAIGNIVNAGTITSAGNLTATAGGQIINALPAGAVGPGPVMQALNNVNLQTANILNSGLIAAQTGSINIASALASNIAINNAAGRLEALSGVINIRDALTTGKFDTLLTGGDVLANALNIYSGTGKITVDVDRLDGLVNVYGGDAYLKTNISALRMGNIKLASRLTLCPRIQ